MVGHSPATHSCTSMMFKSNNITGSHSNQNPWCTQKLIYTRIFRHHIRSWLLCTPVVLRRIAVRVWCNVQSNNGSQQELLSCCLFDHVSSNINKLTIVVLHSCPFSSTCVPPGISRHTRPEGEPCTYICCSIFRGSCYLPSTTHWRDGLCTAYFLTLPLNASRYV